MAEAACRTPPGGGYHRGAAVRVKSKAGFSPRSGRQHKAWGVSPRIASTINQARGAGGSGVIQDQRPPRRLSPAARAPFLFVLWSWGWRPRLYADVRSADSWPCDLQPIARPIHWPRSMIRVRIERNV